MSNAESTQIGPLTHEGPDPVKAPYRRGRLWFISLTHVVNDFYAGSVAALVPFMVAERGYTYAAASAIMFAANVLGSVLQPAFGLLADRWRIPWLAPVGFLMAAVGIGVSGLTGDLLLTCLAVAGTGIGVAAYHPPATRIAKAWAGERTSGLAVFSVGGNIGMALAPLAVSLVVGSFGLAFTPLLAIPAVVLAAVIAVWRGLLRVSPEAHRAHLDGLADKRDDWRGFLMFTAMVIVSSAGVAGIQAFLALDMIERFDLRTEIASGSLTVFTAMGVLGTLAGGWAADRFGHIRTLRFGYLVGPIALLGFLLSPTYALTLVCMAVMGFAGFIPFSVQVALGMKYLPKRVGTSSGITLGLGATVGSLFAPVFGLLADAHGLTVALSVALGVKVLAFGMTFLLRTPQTAAAPITG